MRQGIIQQITELEWRIKGKQSELDELEKGANLQIEDQLQKKNQRFESISSRQAVRVFGCY